VWKKDYCPICKAKLIKTGWERSFTYQLSCSNTSQNIGKIPCHFYLRFTHDKPYYENIILYPYLIESYIDNSNVYAYDTAGLLSRKLLLDVPYINFDWDNMSTKEMAAKIKLYIAFS